MLLEDRGEEVGAQRLEVGSARLGDAQGRRAGPTRLPSSAGSAAARVAVAALVVVRALGFAAVAGRLWARRGGGFRA